MVINALTIAAISFAATLIPSNVSAEVRDLKIENSYGRKLSVSIFGSGETAVILAHENSKTKNDWKFFAEKLQDAGLMAITFNFGSRKQANHEDMIVMIDTAKKEGAKKVFLLGASMGGSASLKAASLSKVDGVIVISSMHHPNRSGSSAPTLDEAQNINEKTLLIVAEGDSPYYQSALKLSEVMPNDRLVVMGGANHGTSLLKRYSSELDKLILSFIR